MAWTDGDFKLFATGLAIGGQWNLGEVKASGIAICYHDVGEYDHFYLKFTKAIAEFSFGQFKETVVVVGKNGEIPVSNATIYNSTTIRIEANIEGEDDGILVAGREHGYLSYASGKNIPKFVSMLWLNELVNFIKLAYIWDKVKFTNTLVHESIIDVVFNNTNSSAHTEHIDMLETKEITDNVTVSYFKQ